MTTPQIIQKIQSQTSDIKTDVFQLRNYLGHNKNTDKLKGETDTNEQTLSNPTYNFVSRTIDINCSYETCSEKLKFSIERYNKIISKKHKPLCKTHNKITALLNKKNLAKKYNELESKYNSAMKVIDTLNKMVNNKTNIDEIKKILSNFKIPSQKDFESFNKEVDKYSLR